MINDKIQNAFNEQIKHELESESLYLSMAAYFHSINLDGFAHWLHVQASEERKHAMRFFDNICERSGRVHLTALAQPKGEWASPLAAFEEAYKHEEFITGKINSLVKLAEDVADYASTPVLNWFVNEQIEEESSTLKIVETLKRVGTSGAGLVMLDKELGKRE